VYGERLLADIFYSLMEYVPPVLPSAAVMNKMTSISNKWEYENPNVWGYVEGE